jgi:heptosyltransferase I
VTLDVGSPRSIAIVMLSALGDAVHVLPVVNALKRRWPESKLTWVVQPVARQLAQEQPEVDEFILFQRRRGVSGLRSFRDLRKQVRGRRFDLLLDFQVYFKAGMITQIMRADTKLGFDRARARDLNWLFTTHRIPPHAPQHVQDQYFEFLHHIGVDPYPVEWNIRVTEAERTEQAQFFAALERPAIAFVVGTSRVEKNWPSERYARALEHAWELGFQPVLAGGPSPFENGIAQDVIGQARVPVINGLGGSVRRLIWLLQGSRLVVSPDTGPLHVARALDRPVVGIYGYTNPKRHAPYQRNDWLVDGYARFPGEDYPISMQYRPDGMQRVTVAAVNAKVEQVLKETEGTAGAAQR